MANLPPNNKDKKTPKHSTKSSPANASSQFIIDDVADADVSISFIKRMKGEDLESHDLETILKFCAERSSDEIKETKISKWLMTVKNWFAR
jgi:hypothetical protein